MSSTSVGVIVNSPDDLIRFKSLLLGRDMEIEQNGITYRGPVKDFVIPSSRRSLMVLLDWQACRHTIGQDKTWKMDINHKTSRTADLSMARVITEEDRGVRIVSLSPAGWRGIVLLSEDNIPKP